MSPERLSVTCRRAVVSDKTAILDLTSRIWDGNDYIPYVLDDWLAESEGLLVVAEHQNQIVGLTMLSRQSEFDWWMQGMRVHPDFDGRGVASQLHDYLLQAWIRYCQELDQMGYLRLTTSTKRLPIHHLCNRTSFEKTGEITCYLAPALPSNQNIHEIFTPLPAEKINTTLAFIQNSPSVQQTFGLIDLGWIFTPPARAHILAAVDHGVCWQWRGGRGFLATWEDDEVRDQPPNLMLQFLAVKIVDMPEALYEFRALASAQGHTNAGWLAPTQPLIINSLNQAGYHKAWDHNLILFTRSSATTSCENIV